MTTPFKATLKPIGHGHTSPPVAFLQILLAWAKQEQDSIFDPNPNFDLYSVIGPKLGLNEPQHNSLIYRKAMACEGLRVLGGDESDWNWQEGRDTTAGPETPDQMEAGAFQVSFNSHSLGKDLQIFLLQRGVTDALRFQIKVKNDPIFDCAYTFRLLRVSTRWDGPINRGWVTDQVDRASVDEWVQLLSA